MLSINHIENTLASSPSPFLDIQSSDLCWTLIRSHSSQRHHLLSHLCSSSRPPPPLQTIMHTHRAARGCARTHLASSLRAAFEVWLNDDVNHAPVVPWQVYPVVVVVYIYLLLIFRHDATSTHGEGKCEGMKGLK